MSRLWVERTDSGQWIAKNDAGAELNFGGGEGQFSPVDLLKIAIAGCAGLSSQRAIEYSLGAGSGAKIVIDGQVDRENNVILSFTEEILVDAIDHKLSEEEVQALREHILHGIERGCTIKHTLDIQPPVRMNLTIRQ